MTEPSNTLQFEPIPDVNSRRGIELRLEHLLEGAIPGFIIRASSHPDTTKAILRIMEELSGNEHHVHFSLPDTAALASRTSVGIGRLHDDARNETTPSIITNKIIRGRAKLHLLEAGPRYTAGNLELQDIAGAHLANTTFDPDIMSAAAYVGELSYDDEAVFPSQNRRGPMLHRVDTIEGPRVTEGNVIRPKQPVVEH